MHQQRRFTVLGSKCVCLSVPRFLPPCATSQPKSDTNGFSAKLCYKVMARKPNEVDSNVGNAHDLDVRTLKDCVFCIVPILLLQIDNEEH